MKYYSNEIVFRIGHPDKVCDQISARLLQEVYRWRCKRSALELKFAVVKV